MDSKKDILLRVYFLYVVFFLLGVAIIGRVMHIMFAQGDYWKNMAQEQTIDLKMIEAVRGNIFSADGGLLATSLPHYEIRMDVNAESISKEFFNDNIDSLSICLSNLFRDQSAREYKIELTKARRDGERYHLIKRKVSYHQLKALRTFPIFRLGKYKGGLIYEQINLRARPFGILAARTIGMERNGAKPIGLEGAYTQELEGEKGKRLMQKIAGGVWIPVNSDNEIEPKDGNDIIASIDINIQDVAEAALMNQLIIHNADHGCVILMEVKTGEVKAIANLSRGKNGEYDEKYNYAIGESTEPGSTFKLASLIAGIEDGLIKITDSVGTNDGTYKFGRETMRDSHEGGYGKITIKRGFEVSSNVAVSRVIYNSYAKNPQKFIDRLASMNLNMPLNLEIPGEGQPYIKNTNTKSWSNVTLPWMSIGYEVKLTPLQILTFYNAIANDGKMVRPKFVKEIRNKSQVVRKIETVVINESICSKETVAKAKEMLEGVVENGTAVNLKNPNYKIAAKTGTAQIANSKYGYKNGGVSYQASLCGYFPADKPQYSCIVVVNAPSNGVFYGNQVAGPIFKEIADKVYSTNLDIHKEFEKQPYLASSSFPFSKNGNYSDLGKVLKDLNIKVKAKTENSEWIIANTLNTGIEVSKVNYTSNLMPNVIGMGIQDATYLLENKGVKVKVLGRGIVKKQSLLQGLPIEKGSEIYLELS